MTSSADLDINILEKFQIVDTIKLAQSNQRVAIDSKIVNLLSIDTADPIYQSFRTVSNISLEVSSIVAGGVGLVKSIMNFTRLVRLPKKIASLSANGMHSMEKVLKVGKFTYTNTTAKHFAEIAKRGPYKGELSRPFMRSQLTISEIMKAGKPIPDPGKIPGALRWDIPGGFRGEGMWELVLHPETNVIYHFNFQ